MVGSYLQHSITTPERLTGLVINEEKHRRSLSIRSASPALQSDMSFLVAYQVHARVSLTCLWHMPTCSAHASPALEPAKYSDHTVL